ncbi:MAG: hypothetical protein ACRDIB_04405, partial [Ardenticatenaceae bacterium]
GRPPDTPGINLENGCSLHLWELETTVPTRPTETALRRPRHPAEDEPPGNAMVTDAPNASTTVE